MPGNIHFAYVGGAAGILGWEIQAGAGVAEIIDPAHDPNSRGFVDEYSPPNRFQMVGWTPWDPSTINFGDGLEDHEAVTAGIQMWTRFGEGMTRSQFGDELAKCTGRLAHCNPDPYPPSADTLRDWTRQRFSYRVGYFDNIGEAFIPERDCLQ